MPWLSNQGKSYPPYLHAGQQLILISLLPSRSPLIPLSPSLFPPLSLLKGIRILHTKNNSHYLPIIRPPEYPPSGFTLDDLPPFRTHREWIQQAANVEAATTKEECRRRSRDCGINNLAMTANMPGIRFPISFPYDLMHLLRNTIENYVLFFSGDFKKLDAGTEDYIISKGLWNEIGAITVASNRTIPSQFGRSLPNIADDRTFFTAEAYLVWATLYAPILLRHRFNNSKYYKHFMLFISILNCCMQLSTTRGDRSALRINVQTWYAEYEQ